MLVSHTGPRIFAVFPQSARGAKGLGQSESQDVHTIIDFLKNKDGNGLKLEDKQFILDTVRAKPEDFSTESTRAILEQVELPTIECPERFERGEFDQLAAKFGYTRDGIESDIAWIIGKCYGIKVDIVQNAELLQS